MQEWEASQPRTNFMYAPGAGGPIFTADSAGLGEWYHYDAGGSVRAVSDPNRLAQSTYAYDVFGVSTAQTGAGDNTRQFKGQQLDPTQLYFTGCGYYDPQAARLIGGCGTAAGPAGAMPSIPATGGNGLDAAEAAALGQGLSLSNHGKTGAGFGSPFQMNGCYVVCDYAVSLIKQPDAIPGLPSNGLGLADWFSLLVQMGAQLGQDPMFARQMLSLALDFIPVVGDIKGIAEGLYGYDLITGDKLALWEQALNLVPLAGGVLGAVWAIGKIVGKVAGPLGDAARLVGKVTNAEGELLGAGLKHSDKLVDGFRLPTNLKGRTPRDVLDEAIQATRKPGQVIGMRKRGDISWEIELSRLPLDPKPEGAKTVTMEKLQNLLENRKFELSGIGEARYKQLLESKATNAASGDGWRVIEDTRGNILEVKTDWDVAWGFNADGTRMTNDDMVKFMRRVDDYLSDNYGFRVWGGHGDHVSFLLSGKAPKSLWESHYTDGIVDVYTDVGKMSGPMFDMYAEFWRYLGP